ncbi:MAG: hypothetical protein KDK39_10415 [Leptospiraceae bacterium]|nr:hypothetical protein [Leptospiraceae bacterium]
MPDPDLILDWPRARRELRVSDPGPLITVVQNDIPYCQEFICYRSSRSSLTSLPAFLVNLPVQLAFSQNPAVLVDFSATWSDIMNGNDHAFGRPSVYNLLRREIRSNGIQKSKHTQIHVWLIKKTSRRAADGDEEYRYELCGYTNKIYFYIGFSGYVIH